ncbi:hypothetical protein KCP69_19320 [Salmonella enterica subsp. enterica]|nr:hypothetical protein KCP69_19320 [Salmonella enterica subsp. enterica]
MTDFTRPESDRPSCQILSAATILRFLSGRVGLIIASCSQRRASRLPLVLTGARGRGGVVLFDAGFHRRGCMFGAVFNALEFFGSCSYTIHRFHLPKLKRHLHATAGWRCTFFLQRFDIISTQQRAGGLALCASMNSRRVAVVVKAPSGISGSTLNSASRFSGCIEPEHVPRLPISSTGRSLTIVFST